MAEEFPASTVRERGSVPQELTKTSRSPQLPTMLKTNRCSPWTGVGWARLGGTAASEAQTHSLQRQIEEKRTKLAAGEVLKQAGPSNVKDLHSPLPIEAFTTPLDGLPPGAVEQQVLLSNGLQGSSSQPSNAWLDSRASEMFLRPAQLQRVRTLWDCWLFRQHCC